MCLAVSAVFCSEISAIDLISREYPRKFYTHRVPRTAAGAPTFPVAPLHQSITSLNINYNTTLMRNNQYAIVGKACPARHPARA
jgi:hypothetical protein